MALNVQKGGLGRGRGKQVAHTHRQATYRKKRWVRDLLEIFQQRLLSLSVQYVCTATAG